MPFLLHYFADNAKLLVVIFVMCVAAKKMFGHIPINIPSRQEKMNSWKWNVLRTARERGAQEKRNIFILVAELFPQSITWRTKVHRMQSQSSVLKRLYEREKRLAGRVKWKSRLSHYLLTIHYWIRYTRF